MSEGINRLRVYTKMLHLHHQRCLLSVSQVLHYNCFVMMSSLEKGMENPTLGGRVYLG